MRRRSLRLVLFALATVAGESQDGAVSLIVPGKFHGKEINARSGEKWLGLAPVAGGFAWRSFEITVRPTEDLLVDRPGEKTGKEVVAKGGNPVFLVRGISLTGKVRAAVAGKTPIGRDGRPLLRFGEHLDSLDLRCEAGCGSNRLILTYWKGAGPGRLSRLVLESDGLRQTLYEWPQGLEDEHCELIWAGDLDGDGKLDLFMDLSGHYNVSERTLFLSSKRTGGELVGKVAVLRTTGC